MSADFHELSPDRVLDCAEAICGERLSNICRPLTSYINRVFELQAESGDGLVIKFYRPGRWTHEALLDEHRFLLDLDQAEVPVIAPLTAADGKSLHESDGLSYALFPRRGGRLFEHPPTAEWSGIGSLLARMHQVGADRDAPQRITLSPQSSMLEHLSYILESNTLPDERTRHHYESTVLELLELIRPAFEDREVLRIHGDCHAANIIHRPDEGYTLIDLDDMANGPPVQDLWMLLPGRRSDCPAELDAFLDGYEQFREFDYPSLRLIEPLRAMRYIHFAAWCARQAGDGGHKRLDSDFGTSGYWQRELQSLEEQIHLIQEEFDEAGY